MSPQPIAVQTRAVGEFTLGGRRGELYVAPTRAGGYCYVFEHGGGSCRIERSDRRRAVGVLFSGSRGPGTRNALTRIAGDVTAPSAARVEAVFAGRTRTAVPFVWVSRPIAAGFFAYDVPAGSPRLEAVVATDARGTVVGSTFIQRSRTYLAYTDGRCRPAPRPASTGRAPPFRPRPVPTSPAPPLQRGSGDGASVVVGANGFAVFDTTGTPAPRLPAAGARTTFGCLRLTREFGIFGVHETTVAATPGVDTGVDVRVRGPFDAVRSGATPATAGPTGSARTTRSRSRSRPPVGASSPTARPHATSRCSSARASSSNCRRSRPPAPSATSARPSRASPAARSASRRRLRR
jgi:hypothetical protein